MDRTTDLYQFTRMKKCVELDENDWGQLLEGLTCRAEQYELTAQYHETGLADGDILDVRDVDEARSLASGYRRMVDDIKSQLNGNTIR